MGKSKASKAQAVVKESPEIQSAVEDQPMASSSDASSSASVHADSDSGSSSSSEDSDNDSEAEAPASSRPVSKKDKSSTSKKRKRAVVNEPLPDLEDPDAPALSHAEKRKQKKKPSAVEGIASSSTSAAKKPGKVTKPEDEPHARGNRQNSIWVGNLSFRTTEAQLREFFAPAGEVTRVNLPLKPVVADDPATKWKSTRDNRGFAYVDFATSDAKVIAITMSEGHLEGRKLLIKDGDDYAGRPAVQASTDRPEGTTNTKFAKRVLGSQKQQPAPTLFLGNLSFETTDASIRQMFDAHRDPKSKAPLRDSVVEKAETADGADGADGAAVAATAEPSQPKEVWIRKVRLGTFEDSGNCKGWAFVDFGSIAAATAALTNPHNHNLDGRDIKVEYASADAVRRGGGAIPRAVRSDAPVGRGGKPLLGKGKYDKGTRTAARDGNTDTTRSPAERPAKRPRMEEQASTHDHDHERGHRNSFAPETNDTAAPARYEDARPAAPPRERRGKDGRMRPAPGAALAMAKRQSVAIVPSQATKIKF